MQESSEVSSINLRLQLGAKSLTQPNANKVLNNVISEGKQNVYLRPTLKILQHFIDKIW